MEARSRFADLPARPPTPPKETSSDGPEMDLTFLAAASSKETSSKPALDTPEESPCSVAAGPTKSSERPCKRVDFQLGTSKLANMTTSSPHDSPVMSRPHPSSRDSRPVKSILKQPTVSSDPHDPAQEPRDFPRMLDDFARQLAGRSSGSRLDAYMQLNNCLKTYKNMPEQQALRDKMPLLATFIERDLQETDIGEGPRSTQLATEVVRLVTTLLWSPTMGDVLPDSFQCFILDKSIAVAGSDNMPKVLVNQYLHLLGVQSFRSKFMTGERAHRIVSNLSKVTEHIKGKQVMAHKLDIYKKLITQARNVILNRFRDWYDCMFHGLLSPHQEIRTRALSLAYEAGVAFGASEQVTKAVMNLFNHKVESKDSKQRYGDLFISRFQERLAIKEERQQVPQLWAAVLLFLRHQPRPLERWAFTGDWLRILQQCFNTGDTELRLQANRAWIRLIYVVDPCVSTTESMATLLRTPLEKQFDRLRATDKETKKLRASVVATYTTLLYYAFRPSSTWEVIDRYWARYVAHFFTPGQSQTLPIDATNGCTVLTTLIGDDRQKVWNGARASESAPIKPDELPRIDPKWTRARASTVLSTVENALLSEEWWSGEIDQTSALRIWRAFTKALGEASRKEVKVSSETMHAVAELVSTLIRFFIRTTLRAVPPSTVYQRLTALIETAMDYMGYLPFAEQRLVRAAPEQFAVIAAPAGRAHKATSPQITAFSGLLDAVVSSVGSDAVSTEAGSLLTLLIKSATRAGSSRGSRLNILRGICSRTMHGDGEVSKLTAQEFVWTACAGFLVEDLRRASSEDAVHDSSGVQQQDLRNAAKILEMGPDMVNAFSPKWIELLNALKKHVCGEAGFTAWMFGIVKPLAEHMIAALPNGLNETLLRQVSTLIQATSKPYALEDIETPRKDVSNVLGISSKRAQDAFVPILNLVSQTLFILYGESEKFAALRELEMLDTLPRLTKTGLVTSFGTSVKILEKGMAAWVEDRNGILNVESLEATMAFGSVVNAWKSFADEVASMPAFNQQALDNLNQMLSAGLGSRHRAIANQAIEMWNATFGREQGLFYPDALREVLLRLSSAADISIPALGIAGFDFESSRPTMPYLSTPSDLADLDPDTERYDHLRNVLSTRQHRRELATLAPIGSPMAKAKGSPMATPDRPRSERKPRSTPRLRHDNSQIEFAAITSSPPNIEALESQLLTEHQREVRDRQHAESNAMFPDLRSSPLRKHQERDVPRLKLRPDETLPRSNLDDPHSPTLPPPSATPFLGSSPTPSQRRPSSRERASASARASVEHQLAALDGASSNRENRGRVVPKRTASDNSSDMQTFGEELLALYEEPLEEFVMYPPSSSEIQLSSESDPLVAEVPDEATATEQMLEPEVHEIVEEPVREATPLVEEPVPAEPVAEFVPFEPVTTEESREDDSQIAAQIFQDMEQLTSQETSTGDEGMATRSRRSGRSKRKRDLSPAPVAAQGEKRSRPQASNEIKWPGTEPMPLAMLDDDLEDCIVVACKETDEPRQEVVTATATKAKKQKAEPQQQQRRPVKSSSPGGSSSPGWDAVFNVPPTPEVKRKTAGPRKRLSPEPAPELEPATKRSRSAGRVGMRTRSSQATEEELSSSSQLAEDVAVPEEPLQSTSEEEAENLLATSVPDTEEATTGSSAAQPEAPAAVEAPMDKATSPAPAPTPSPVQSTPRRLAAISISGSEFLARVRQLFADARHLVLGGETHGDEIMAGLMDVGREVMEAKRRL